MTTIQDELAERTPGSAEVARESGQVLAQQIVDTVVMGHPVYIGEAKGSRVTDVDGNEYIDLAMGWGPHVLGHAPEVVVEAVREAAPRGVQWGWPNPYQEPLARLITEAMPCAERVVFCNSGTEASMYAMRAARAHTGRSKIAMFEGGFNGAHDAVLAKVVPGSPDDSPQFYSMGQGIPSEAQSNLVMLPYLSDAALRTVRERADELAMVIIEPVQGSNPRIDQGPFLAELREACRESGVLLCFDEVITGFRLAYGGAQEYFGVVPDLAITGKVPGGGMPLGVIAGRADVMEVFSRQFDIYRDTGSGGPSIFTAGTFSGNPVSMSAGAAVLGHLRDHQEIYPYMEGQVGRIAREINEFCMREELPAHVAAAGSMFYVRVQPGGPIRTARDADPSLREADDMLPLLMEKRGVLMPALHLCFISAAHTPEDIDIVIDALRDSLAELRSAQMI